MIVWLASYPKSGNTLLRAILSAYFYSNDGLFNLELLNKIRQFPVNSYFKEIGINTEDDKAVIQNYIKAQEYINKNNEINFLKTHSSFCRVNESFFTDTKNTLGVIYVIRDPRNVLTSYAHHFGVTEDESLEALIKGKILTRTNRHAITFVGPWGYHFKTWKNFEKESKYLLVNYEDLINNKKVTIIKILKFIFKIQKNENQIINHEKLNNIIVSTEFKYMQDLERKSSFEEAKTHPKTGEKLQFFHKGPNNKWKNSLSPKFIKEIEKNFSDEMKETGYL